MSRRLKVGMRVYYQGSPQDVGTVEWVCDRSNCRLGACFRGYDATILWDTGEDDNVNTATGRIAEHRDGKGYPVRAIPISRKRGSKR